MINDKIEGEITSLWSSNILIWLNNELGYIFLLLFSIPAFFNLKKAPLNSFKTYITIYSLFLFTQYIFLFHTATFGIVLMCDRMWMMLIAPLSILASYFIFQPGNRYQVLFIAILLALLGIANYFMIGESRSFVFLLFVLALLGAHYLKDSKHLWKLIPLIPFLVLYINFIHNNSNYKTENLNTINVLEQEIKKLNSPPQKTIFYADELYDKLIIFNQFSDYNHLLIQPYKNYTTAGSNANNYVIINKESSAIPLFFIQQEDKWNLISKKKKYLVYHQIAE